MDREPLVLRVLVFPRVGRKAANDVDGCRGARCSLPTEKCIFSVRLRVSVTPW